MDDHNAPSEPELGFGSFGDDIGRKEPILGLPSMSALSTPPAYEENTEDETEEVMNDTGKIWISEDELPHRRYRVVDGGRRAAMEQFNNERRRSASAFG